MDQLAPSQMDQLTPTIPHCKSSRMTGASLNLEKESTHDGIPYALSFQKMYNMYVLFDTQGRKKQNDTGARNLITWCKIGFSSLMF